ncbi:MAG TPA: alkaline phosphatase family protein [Chitinophagaceae bacterium]|jgi:predicted AlkP superfamily pyrophosphatase or phosphodiesterase|nr:alkaline phosphatase family protein [Chitinophagaceae bacterium]
MRKSFFLLGLIFFHLGQIRAQATGGFLVRPRLVVGIVVDQMRWDYLYRYYDRYSEGGFKRLLKQGFSCENTYINYLPSSTAVGHTCIYSGSVPSITGIAGNDWTDQLTGARVYCTDDSTVKAVGVSASPEGKMSPRNLLVTTITDELRMATNYQSRVVGVSLKDRAAILPAGHTANAAYWMDDSSGNFISSTYYMNKLPQKVEDFNKSKPIEQFLAGNWNTLYPISTYVESDSDNRYYEGRLPGEVSPVFPHHIKAAYAKNHESFRTTPFGNTLTLNFAKLILDAYQLGMGPATDFLAINCASTDYVGHVFGPNSIEIEDTYLRLDLDLASFLSALDAKIGRGQYVVFLTADHGAAHAVNYSQENRMPADFYSATDILSNLDQLIAQKYGLSKAIRSAGNYQINFDLDKIAAANADLEGIKKLVVDYLKKQPGVSYAVDMDHVREAAIPEPIRTMIVNGYNYKRSGQVQVIFQPGWLERYAQTGTTHGTWNPYDTHIPLIFMGWDIQPGATANRVQMTDIAPTLATLLHIQPPSGNIGTPIVDLLSR